MKNFDVDRVNLQKLAWGEKELVLDIKEEKKEKKDKKKRPTMDKSFVIFHQLICCFRYLFLTFYN